MMLSCLCARAAADSVTAEPPTGLYASPPKHDPPRWRLRGMLATGAGVGLSGIRQAIFPTTLEIDARIWGPLSASLSGAAIIASREVVSCGAQVRGNAALGSLGLRADLNNSRSASWLSPFIEAHANLGGQAAFAEPGEPCAGPRLFGSGGARVGVDVWLGRVAVTAQLSYDYMPVAAPLAFSLGASTILF
jgi:hypothetical protein